MAFHANAHDADLGDMAVGDYAVESDLFALVFEQRLRTRQIGLRYSKGHVGFALIAPDILNDHIDIDAGIGERLKDMRHRARLIRDAREDDLRLILVMRLSLIHI